MTSARRFDYDEFVEDFRVACARHGIDPARGASEYQVVHVVTEARRAAWQPERWRWWHEQDLWLNCEPYRSETEQEAIWNVFLQAYGLMARRIVQAVRLRRATMALRELHEQRGGR